MDQPTQRFPANTRVRLREGVDSGFYGGFSRVGCEGWVRRRKLDRYGYPQILVEWDKDHWAYNGQEDCWTWEGHFEAVGDISMPEQPQQPKSQVPDDDEKFKALMRDISETFVKNTYDAIAAYRGETSPVGHEADPEPEQPKATAETKPEIKEEDWETLVNEATKLLGKSPAYVLVALDRVTAEGQPTMIVPRVFHASRDPEYGLVIQSQLAALLAGFTEQTVQRILAQKSSDGE